MSRKYEFSTYMKIYSYEIYDVHVSVLVQFTHFMPRSLRDAVGWRAGAGRVL